MMKAKELELSNTNNTKNRTAQKQTVENTKVIAPMTNKISNATISGLQRNRQQPPSFVFKKPSNNVPAAEG